MLKNKMVFPNNDVNEYKSMIPGLERIKKFLSQSDIKYNDIPYVHIAGTNGKGSTAKILSEILMFSGYKTGLYISPHLVKINERIQINSLPISDLELKKLYDKYLSLIKKHKLTFFEYITALALIYFKNKKVDIVVLETGLGGRFDATNVITPLVSIITSIDLDHSEILGKKLSQIAFEKAGIIKKDIPLVCGNIKKTALKEIKKAAEKQNSKVYLLDKDFKTTHLSYNWKKYTQKIEYKGLNSDIKFDLSLLGKSQVCNVGVVLCACELLKNKKFEINFNSLIHILNNIKWQARFDIRKLKIDNKNITIVLDGAHNSQAIDNFLELYKESPFSNKRNKIVFAIMQEKEYKKIVKNISAIASSINLVNIDNSRAVKIEELQKEFLKYIDSKNISLYSDIKECFKNVKNNEILFCVGSFYLAGKIIKFIEEYNV
ncbi:MAG: folylpolyglutamate synthase/dihydrofolate synthase family protein [Endomicrobiia bacterium]